MANYNEEDLFRGAGAFDQAMLSQDVIPGRAGRMAPGVAIGVLSAAMRSGLPSKKFEQLIDGSFAPSAALLKRLLAMYEGDDWSITLWEQLESGKYKLCTALLRQSLVGWRYDPSAGPEDD